MQFNSQEPPLYFPDPQQATVLRLGLQPLHLNEWMPTDADFPQFQAHKLAMRQQLDYKVYQTQPGSTAAQKELQNLLVEHLVGDQKHLYRIDQDRLRYMPSGIAWSLQDSSLWNSSLWVQEDICIMELIDNDYCLTAASVCSPSNWKLEEKIGQTLDVIHNPVPDYGEILSQRVRRLFDGIRPKKPVVRYNWSIQPGNGLCWRDDVNDPDVDNAGKYWRVERQTLRRLPETGAIVFTIRIFLHSFEKLKEFPGFETNLRAILLRLPAKLKAYKGL